MNTQEAAALLAIAAAFDNRKPDPDAATAWSLALDGLRFVDCRDAIVAHYRESAEWMMPSHVVSGVKRIRRDRIRSYGAINPPDGLDPDAYFEWQRDTMRAIGDGDLVAENPVRDISDNAWMRRRPELENLVKHVDDA